MTRKEAIEHIETLFPPDSQYPDTAAVGRELLEKAKRQLGTWKSEPTEVLIRFAALCVAKDKEGVGL